jgi:hypothetical protein
MTAVLKFLGKITNDIFERQMRRAALRIGASQHFFAHHAA